VQLFQFRLFPHPLNAKLSNNENESLYYYQPLIPPPPPTDTHTYTHEYETGSGWHVQTNWKAWRKKCVFRLTLKVGREGGRSSQVGWQQVPDSRSNVTKRTFTEGFQVCFWNFEQYFCRISKGASWLICAERRRQVWRKSAVKVTECEHCKLVLNAVFYWEPVEFFQKQCDMITLRFFQDKPYSIVLDL